MAGSGVRSMRVLAEEQMKEYYTLHRSTINIDSRPVSIFLLAMMSRA